MFCQNCGSQIPDGANICPNCGTPVKQVPDSQQQGSIQPQYGQQQFNQNQYNQPQQYNQNQYNQGQYGQQQYGQPQYGQQQYGQQYGNYGQKPKSNIGIIIGIFAGICLLFTVIAAVVFFTVIKPKLDELKEDTDYTITKEDGSKGDSDFDDGISTGKKNDDADDGGSGKKNDKYANMTADDFSTYDTPVVSDFDYLTSDLKSELNDKLALDMELSDLESLEGAEQITDNELIKGGWKAMTFMDDPISGFGNKNVKMNVFIGYDISDDKCEMSMKGLDEGSVKDLYDSLGQIYGDELAGSLGTFEKFLEEIKEQYEGAEPYASPYIWKNGSLEAYEHEDDDEPMYRLIFYTLNDGRQYGICAMPSSSYSYPIVLVRP